MAKYLWITLCKYHVHKIRNHESEFYEFFDQLEQVFGVLFVSLLVFDFFLYQKHSDRLQTSGKFRIRGLRNCLLDLVRKMKTSQC